MEYLAIILIGFLISIPTSHYMANVWLQDFAFQLESFLWITIYSPLIVIIVALATIAIISLKSAKTNPIEILRNE